MEKALLVTVELTFKKLAGHPGWTASERGAELHELAKSAGAIVLHEEIVRRNEISPSHYIGKGKAEEFKAICQEKKISAVIFNNDLAATQAKNLEDIIGVKVIDRTQLILDIFARRARSNEGKIQVELAQLLYLLPRLTGKGVELSRMGGGIGTVGPGEQKLEIDRRKIRDRIAKLKGEIENIKKHRDISRKKRANRAVASIVFIGYTNAGKSTLLNALTGSNVLAQDKLFSTLDPTTRGYVLPNNQKVTFSDTVGFLDDLPHHLIEAFKATLEEVVDADLLIHVIDISHPKHEEHRKAVHEVLKDLGVENKPILQVLNKVDKVTDQEDLRRIEESFVNSILTSAVTGYGLHMLLEKIIYFFKDSMSFLKLKIPQSEIKTINILFEHANVLTKEYKGNNAYFEAEIPSSLTAHFEKYKIA